MLRVLNAGMQRLGLPSPAQHWLEQATVPLDAKQQLVLQVMQQRGASALLKLGQGVHDLQHDSLMPMLVHSGDPLRMLGVWLRLERYLHSRHRIVQSVLRANRVAHQHVSIRAGTEPEAAEDLVVLGVLIALLERTGCQTVQAQLAQGPLIWPLDHSTAQAEAIHAAFVHRRTGSWILSWDGTSAPSPPPDAVQQTQAPNALSLRQRLELLIAQTQPEALALEQAAQQIGQSARSLQRNLQREGVRYVDVVANARAQRASQLLVRSQASLAEIGFSCGYTDQAHFCRDFKRRVGLSPQRYRDHSRGLV